MTGTNVADRRNANVIRALTMDAVQKANSGHPGMPMGMADVAEVLFTQFMKFDPTAPEWPDRDRFVLSAGHGSMLLYSLLFLTGYEDMTLDQIKNFRQLGARTAGHPEYGEAKGIETTTGPLGQGIATAVGMAMAERFGAARYGNDLVDHYTYALAGDGCLMEGISHEAISMAGHLKLGKLIVLFDDNGISIDGSTDLTVSDDQLKRFEASGWDTQAIDGHDPKAIAAAIEKAKATNTPSLIACKTVIGFGAPNKQGTSGTHGSPLGDEEIALTRAELGWEHGPFEVPQDVLDHWRAAGAKGKSVREAWEAKLATLPADQKAEWDRTQKGDVPAALDDAINQFKATYFADPAKKATRAASEMVLNAINPVVPETIGGSADLTGSNNTKSGDQGIVTPDDFSGRYVHYGVREHGMAAAMNGIALHGGFIPYGGTFLVFTDYCRPSIRLSALMEQRVIYVMTHDSIGLGEDGPTHQPVEHVASLRAMPNVNVYRPADIIETAECWQLALKDKDTPSILALTRQGLPQVRLTDDGENKCAKGAYVLAEASADAKAVIMATGSEIELAMEARETLEGDGVPTRVVSVPCMDLFAKQDAAYRQALLGGEGVARVAVEAGVRQGWDALIGLDGGFVGMNSFGASAPASDLFNHFGITAAAVVHAVRERV